MSVAAVDVADVASHLRPIRSHIGLDICRRIATSHTDRLSANPTPKRFDGGGSVTDGTKVPLGERNQ